MLTRSHLAALALCGAPLLACKSGPHERETPSRTCGDSIHDLGWLSGSWLQATAPNTLEEHWTHADGGTLMGVSRAVVQGKTVFFEYMRIEAREDGLYYVAQPMGRPGTDFKLVRCNSSGVLFENLQNEHPKHIRYERLSPTHLSARIEGEKDGKPVAQDFHFTRM
ncbi:hypothetical protein MYSTI_04650 [Myxococcus stipitatus DSM 14675]|uniref:DUF6265 domain-containing protein n=1 Tax=Myxococcus stipitatus (strain DSM 14675 / JCM 12634 / Mx s8) TaxID=1278073 RepID=L7UED1_MYXSD|nr:DUF6265 family protein [Myxococcus stipitatus]AGC45942.1 hypothetical protein MYSTI_04650 [Myxococcus stipitatus DSM 14675]